MKEYRDLKIESNCFNQESFWSAASMSLYYSLVRRGEDGRHTLPTSIAPCSYTSRSRWPRETGVERIRSKLSMSYFIQTTSKLKTFVRRKQMSKPLERIVGQKQTFQANHVEAGLGFFNFLDENRNTNVICNHKVLARFCRSCEVVQLVDRCSEVGIIRFAHRFSTNSSTLIKIVNLTNRVDLSVCLPNIPSLSLESSQHSQVQPQRTINSLSSCSSTSKRGLAQK